MIFFFRFTAILGWSSWSEWTPCNEDGERMRFRKCLTTDPDSNECQGNERDIRACIPEQSNGTLKVNKMHFKQFKLIYFLLCYPHYRIGSNSWRKQFFHILFTRVHRFSSLLELFYLHLHEKTNITSRH